MDGSTAFAGPGSRFALDEPHGALPASDAPPSSPGVRPFGLRFSRPFTSVATPVAVIPAYRYCQRRQIAILADTADVPMFRHTNPRTTESTGTPDGARPGSEETRSDWQNG